MGKLRLGIIGTGAFVEECHLPGLQSHGNANVIVLCGRDYDRTRLLADRFGVPDVMRDYRELCSRDDIDAVTIASRNVDHASQAIAAIKGNKHVFCEKPLATSVKDAEEMVASAKSTNKICQVAFTYRYLYGIQFLKRLVSQGDIGKPHYVRIQYDTWQGLASGFRVGFRDRMELAGGGVLFDVGSHCFDLARYLLGPIAIVSGFTTHVPRSCPDSHTGLLTEVETDDIAGALFQYRDGVRGQVFVSRVTPSLGPKGFVEIIGRDGALRAMLSRGSVDLVQRSSPQNSMWEEVPLPDAAALDGKPHCLGLMMRSFVDACGTGRLDEGIDASFSDGLSAQKAVAAVAESAKNPGWVEVEGWE
jgi:predicted dehydrogenase